MNGFTGTSELYLILPKHRGEENAGNRADTLVVVVLVMMLMVVLMAMLPMPLAMVLVIFGFLKQTRGA